MNETGVEGMGYWMLDAALFRIINPRRNFDEKCWGTLEFPGIIYSPTSNLYYSHKFFNMKRGKNAQI